MGVRAGSFGQALRLASAAGWDEANRRAAAARREAWSAEDWNHAAATFRRVLHALGFDEQGSPHPGETDTMAASTRFTH